MSEQEWSKIVPTVEGWYWVKWKKSERTEGPVGMFYFDGSEYDLNQFNTRAELFYGPLMPPALEKSQ